MVSTDYNRTRYAGEKVPRQPHHRSRSMFAERKMKPVGDVIHFSHVQRARKSQPPQMGLRTSNAPFRNPHIRSSFLAK